MEHGGKTLERKMLVVSIALQCICDCFLFLFQRLIVLEYAPLTLEKGTYCLV